MEFRTVFVLWLLVLVPCALGSTKRFKRDAMDTANQNANQAFQNMQDLLLEVKSGLSAEQQERLNTIASSNPEFVTEFFELLQTHAGDPTGNDLKQAVKAFVEKYLNGDAGPQSTTPDIPNTPNIPNIPDTTDTPAIPDLPDIPDVPDWVQEVISGFSAEQQRRLMTIVSDPNFVREYGELMQKNGTNTDEFKQAVKALFEKYSNGGARPQSTTPDIPNTPAIPDIPDISDAPDWVQEIASGFSAEQQRRLMTIAFDPNFLREYGKLQQKYGNGTDEFKQAVKALLEQYLNGGARPQSTTPDIPNTPAIPDIPDLSDAPDWFQEIASGFSAEKQRRLMTLASNPNYLREYGELQQKYGNGTDEFKQAVKALTERYVNGGAGLVVSLVALVASLVVQWLVMFG